MVQEFAIAEGTRGLTLDDVAHLLIPGRGRDDSGEGLRPESYARVVHAHAVYTNRNLAAGGGRIVCSGYKSPSDDSGKPWSPDDARHEEFQGVPEADSMRTILVALGVPPDAIHVERHSIDTATNLILSETGGFFGDDRPVAIIAQEAHLRRILDIVAPRTLRRDYLGIIVPEPDTRDADSRIARLVSQYVLRGMSPRHPRLKEITMARTTRVWRMIRMLRRAV